MGKGVLTPEGSLPTSCHIAAIGPSTAKAVHLLLGTKPTLIPPQAVAESLAEALLPHATQPDGSPTRFLLVRAEAARDILPETLRKAGGEVTIAPAYRTVIPQDSLPLIRRLFHSPETYPDAITFTSSSTVTNLLALLAAAGLSLPRNIPRISIGPITSQTLRDNNLPPHAESSEPAIESIVDKIIRCIG
jgi:uroporphyrinogen-III synthase